VTRFLFSAAALSVALLAATPAIGQSVPCVGIVCPMIMPPPPEKIAIALHGPRWSPPNALARSVSADEPSLTSHLGVGSGRVLVPPVEYDRPYEGELQQVTCSRLGISLRRPRLTIADKRPVVKKIERPRR
jgi:hypothetical protein